MNIDQLITKANESNEVNMIDLPQIGEVYLTSMTGTARDGIEARIQKGESYEGLRAKVVACCLCDELGKRQVVAPPQVKQLGDMPATTLNTLFEAAMKASGLAEDAVEDASKNSESGQSDSSG